MQSVPSSTSLRRIIVLFLAAVMGGVSAARGQDTITLRGSAEVAEGKVTLKDVADLSGKAAEALAEVVVLDKWTGGVGGEASWMTLEITTIRASLNATPNVNWGRLSLNGSSCTVRRVIQVAKAPAAAPQAVAATPATDGAADGPRVRDQIGARLAEVFSVDEKMLRLAFEDSAKGLLDLPSSGRVVEITPNGVADRVPLTIRVFEQDRIVASGTTRVGVTIRRDVLVAKAAMKRGDLLALKDAQIEARWVGPTVPAADIADFGSVVRVTKLAQGQMILDSDLELAVVVKKGEMVSVSCIAGSVILTTMARACDDGRVGDVVKFEGTDKKKQTFLARVAGPGKAVTLASGTETAEQTQQVSQETR